jgi:predicted DNA-binding transcriptional regulator YafY
MTTNTVAQTITEGSRVRIVYKDHANEITERVIDVERIWQARNGAMCVIAFCHRRGERRTFDESRILAAMPDDSTFIHTFGMIAAAHRTFNLADILWGAA